MADRGNVRNKQWGQEVPLNNEIEPTSSLEWIGSGEFSRKVTYKYYFSCKFFSVCPFLIFVYLFVFSFIAPG